MKMKNFSGIIILLFITLFLASCQKEASELIDETPEETIGANSELLGKLLSASQNKGARDNIIDGSSCISVKLPVNVYANTQLLSINSISDYQLIQAIFDISPIDIDTIEIVFPITVVYEDYNEAEIGSQNELNTAIAACNNFIDDTYRCLDFVYPISCFIYNIQNEQTGSVTLQNDLEWFYYLEYLTEDLLIAIDYQMEVMINGSILQINSNQELLAAFASANCEIDPGGGIDPDVEALRTVMMDGTWRIAQFLDDGNDETADYNGFNFTFMNGITVYATNGSDHVYGIWVVSLLLDELNFEFDMDSPINGADDDAYKITDFNENWVTMITRDSSGNVEDTLIFNKN
ncbi:hypothetical protein [Ulvibacter antarcticus]|uniref:Lipoprotein n=1 Tax=Ulvibacter antarcticus TaxID=442714 RepID=A0A3L9YRE9_9FLAO|nr:hypothetical protein [Ulvibacter antarcticus]RMA57052.1 hypothetical protein BXY75_2933 [Ulvibacter antarcticus]